MPKTALFGEKDVHDVTGWLIGYFDWKNLLELVMELPVHQQKLKSRIPQLPRVERNSHIGFSGRMGGDVIRGT